MSADSTFYFSKQRLDFNLSSRPNRSPKKPQTCKTCRAFKLTLRQEESQMKNLFALGQKTLKGSMTVSNGSKDGNGFPTAFFPGG